MEYELPFISKQHKYVTEHSRHNLNIQQTFNFVNNSPHFSKFGGFFAHSDFKSWYNDTTSFKADMMTTTVA